MRLYTGLLFVLIVGQHDSHSNLSFMELAQQYLRQYLMSLTVKLENVLWRSFGDGTGNESVNVPMIMKCITLA